MKNLYSFLAGLLVAFVLLRGWQPEVGRYQLSASSNGVGAIDTVTGQVWSISAGEWKELGKVP